MFRFASVSLALLLVAAAPMSAQVETGQIGGTVVDVSGAAIPSATATARNDDTGFSRTTQAGASGSFSLSELPAGNYTITVSAPSFGRFEEKAVLTVGQFLSVQAKLGADAKEVIEVSATENVVALNTENNEQSQVISPQQIINLPSLTRNPYDFVALSGNISTDVNGGQGQGIGASIGGGRSSGTEVLLDGVENINLFSQTVGQTIPLDSVQEYRIITSGFDARYGRATGGIVNLTTKTGTNRFHGSLYEYNRISALASNTHYEDSANFANRAAGLPNNKPDHFTRNQFGYSVGGPIRSDKLFFFSNTEWERIRSSAQQEAAIPTSSFLATTSAQTQAFFTQYGKVRPGATLGQTYAVGNIANAVQQVLFTLPAQTTAGLPENTYFTLDRVDYSLSSKTNLYFRYGYYSENDFAGTIAYSPYSGYDTGQSRRDQTGLLSLSHTFSPSLIYVGKVSYTRDKDLQPLGTSPTGPTLYALAGGATDQASGLNLAFPGYLPFTPGNAIPFGGPQNFYQVTNDFQFVKGRNDVHVGGEFDQLRDNRVFGAYENSVNTLSAKNEADAFAHLQTGNLYSFQAAIYPQGELPCANSLVTGKPVVTPGCTLTLPLTLPNTERNNTFNDGSVYGQDTVHVSKNATLTAGLRWEYFGVQHNHNPNLESNFFLGQGSSFQAQFRAGNVFTTPNSPIHALYGQQFGNFAPRFGFAVDLFGDGKYTMRGGYGISYERNYGNVTFNAIQNPPNYAVVSLTAQDAGGTDVPTLPITTENFGPLAGTVGSKAFPITSLRPVSQNIKTAYQENYNLSVAHQFRPGAIVELTYAGARGIHLYSLANVNRSYFGGNYLGDARVQNRLQPQYGNANLRGANGDSHYDSLNVRSEFDQLRSLGIHFTANYTFSHSLDDNSSTFDTGGGSSAPTGFLGYLDPFNPRSSYGNSDFDTRHRIALSSIYEPVFLSHHGTLLKETLGGITFAPIFVARSGSAFNVWDNSDTSGQATPNIIRSPGLKFHGSPTPNGGVNTYNYIQIPLASMNPGHNPIHGFSDLPCQPGVNGCTFTVGLDRNQFFSPSTYNFDLGSYKTFAIGERFHVQFRAEFYNILNHSNQYVVYGSSADFSSIVGTDQNNNPTPGYLTTAKGSPGGTPSAVDERRNVQLALRFDF